MNLSRLIMNNPVIENKLKLRKRFLRWLYQRGPLMRPGMKLLELVIMLGKIPPVRKLQPWIKKAKSNMSYLPINATLKSESSVIPSSILHEFIDSTPYHAISNTCGCRLAQGCDHFTHEIGCLFMGETALKLSPGTMKVVTKEEAHRHADRAIEHGLTPMIGKVRVDHFIFLEKDIGKLLSVCFCCHCCCMMGYFRHIPHHDLHKIFHPLDGLSIMVNDNCIGCGTCVSYCRFKNIRVIHGRAIHSEGCIGCGRCERYCPNNAVTIKLNDKDFKKKAYKRIESFVDIQ